MIDCLPDATAKIAAKKNKEELAIFYCFVLMDEQVDGRWKIAQRIETFDSRNRLRVPATR